MGGNGIRPARALDNSEVIRTMLIRMTGLGTLIATSLTAGAVALGGMVGLGSGDGRSTSPAALVIDAALARNGRDLVDPRLESAGAQVRLPRTAAEARSNVRYFEAAGYRVVVAGSDATAAAGASAVRAGDLAGALAAAGR
jgi:hypothetical protein